MTWRTAHGGAAYVRWQFSGFRHSPRL